jgi:hypothetical protein
MILNDDEWLVRMIKLMIEFQVIESNPTDFLIDRDIIKVYKMDI